MHAARRQRRGRDTRGQRARVISCDEMWTYVGARRKGWRRSVWIWTAVGEETDGRPWRDFEVGARDRETFLRRSRRLPDAPRYRSDPYAGYGELPPARHVVGKGGAGHRHEGLHAVWRLQLHRWVRRTKGYSKNVARREGLLSMVWLREGWI